MLHQKFPYYGGYLISSPGLNPQGTEDVKLFTPYKISDVVLKNRIVIPPMCQYSAIDGAPNDYHLANIGRWAIGGAGLIIMEATAVAPNGRISPYDLGLWKDEFIPEYKRIVDLSHSFDAKIGIQIAHAGRKACTPPVWIKIDKKELKEHYPEWKVVGPSPIPFDENHVTPHELTVDEIKQIVQDFVAAATRADKAGFDVLEIHGAHGYLISSFLSPNANQRKDEYGGSFENRIRLLLEITDEVRKVWPKNKGFIVRISCSEYVEGGWSIEDTVKLSKILYERGVDMIHCSSGAINSKQVIKDFSEGYQVPFAAAVKEAGIPSIAVGCIETPSYAESVLKEGKADLIAIGRGSLKNPSWAFRAAEELGVEIVLPIQHKLQGGYPKNEPPQIVK